MLDKVMVWESMQHAFLQTSEETYSIYNFGKQIFLVLYCDNLS